MQIHHSTLQRLAFIKYLHSRAIDQSGTYEPMSAASILGFHDSIELFLQLSAETLNIGNKQIAFMEYWNLLAKKLEIPEFPQKVSMRNLNEARVGLKHAGRLPSKLDIETYKATTNLFFQEATTLVFNIEFAGISLIEYVSPEEVRDHVKNAEIECKEGEFDKSATEIALAFEKLISAYVENIGEHKYLSPFDFGRNLENFGQTSGNRDSEFVEYVERVTPVVAAMQRAIKILALGLDYRKYSKFIRQLPPVIRVQSGEYQVSKNRIGYIDEDYIDFCINYIIECAIKLKEFDYEMNPS